MIVLRHALVLAAMGDQSLDSLLDLNGGVGESGAGETLGSAVGCNALEWAEAGVG